MAYKVVYNADYGGFGVSVEGAKWLLANGADPVKVKIGEDLETEPDGREYGSVKCSLDRHDPLLVRMVETLGGHRAHASGMAYGEPRDSTKLLICEITQPMYYIHEYDGAETVVEPGRHVYIDARLSYDNAMRMMYMEDSRSRGGYTRLPDGVRIEW